MNQRLDPYYWESFLPKEWRKESHYAGSAVEFPLLSTFLLHWIYPIRLSRDNERERVRRFLGTPLNPGEPQLLLRLRLLLTIGLTGNKRMKRKKQASRVIAWEWIRNEMPYPLNLSIPFHSYGTCLWKGSKNECLKQKKMKIHPKKRSKRRQDSVATFIRLYSHGAVGEFH